MPDKASWPLSRQPLSSRWPACDGDLMKSLQREETRTRTIQFSSVHFSGSVVSDSLQHMDCSTPGYPVCHQLPEFTQTHFHWVSDAIQQPSHPLSFPSPLTFNQGLFKWVSSSHQVTKVLGVSASTSVLPMNIEDWFSLGWTGWIPLLSKGLSRGFSNTTVQKHQLFSTQPSS